MAKRRVVLAYSGGLDTSVMLPWLVENLDAEVITYTGDLGSGDDAEAIRAKALASGAREAVVEDLRERFVREHVWPALRAGALYEGAYPLATALGRPLLARRLVETARAVGADAVAHGCTGKGNDQVRFEVSVRALEPGLEVIAPLRSWELRTREQEIAYAAARGIPVEATAARPYSIDVNVWGVAIECGALEDPWTEPPRDAWRWTAHPEKAPDAPAELSLAFEAGRPVSLDGVTLGPVALLARLNDAAGAHGVGRIDLIENRLVGIKSREVYEAPAAVVLHAAHRELERLVLDRATLRFRDTVSREYADLVYNGLWYAPLRCALDAWVEESERPVTGEVRLELYKGCVRPLGRRSPYSLYDEGLATYGASDTFDRGAAAGFVRLWGLPLEQAARVRAGRGGR